LSNEESGTPKVEIVTSREELKRAIMRKYLSPRGSTQIQNEPSRVSKRNSFKATYSTQPVTPSKQDLSLSRRGGEKKRVRIDGGSNDWGKQLLEEATVKLKDLQRQDKEIKDILKSYKSKKH